MSKVPAVEHRYYYAVAPRRLFAALTEPSRLAEWFVDRAVLSPTKGSAFRFTWGTYTLRGRVKSVDPPRKLVLTWRDRFGRGKVLETEVKFVVRKRGRGALLTVTHSGFKDGRKWIALYGAIQSGWAHYLTNLRSVLEHGTDLRRSADALT